MSEKEKNKGKRKPGCAAYLLILVLTSICVIVILTLLGPYIGENDRRNRANCSDLPESMEWSGIVEFEDTPKSSILITEENASQLVPLGNTNLNYELPYYYELVLSHPRHNYLLSQQNLTNSSDTRPELVVCSADGEMVKVLTDFAYHVAFSPDGRYFAATSARGEIVEVYDASSFELHGVIGLDENYFNFAFHPTESLMAIVVYVRQAPDRLEIWN